MRLTALVLSTALLALATMSGLATAGSSGEEILALDLTPAGGGIYYLGCITGSKDLNRCGVLSLWAQTNPISGLQTSGSTSGDQQYKPDDHLLS